MSAPQDHLSLRHRLDRLADQGARQIRRVRRRGTLGRALTEGAWTAVVLADLMVVAELARVVGWSTWSPAASLVPVLAGIVALPALWVGARLLWATSRPVLRVDALAVADDELDLLDRLLAADEFLARPDRTAFHEAAIDDTESALSLRPTWEFELVPESVSWQGRFLPSALACAALMLLLAWLGSRSPAPVTGPGEDPAKDLVAQADDPTGVPPTPPDPPVAPEQEPNERRSEAPTRMEDRTPRGKDQAVEMDDQTKQSEGATGSGRMANAMASSGASTSRGVPSQQTQTSEESSKKSPPKKVARRKPAEKKDEKPRKQNEEQSGSTAGRGSSKGSSRNPAATSWSSKDQVTAEDDQDLEDDEEAEDEEEDQESRGGVQPALRDRRPPVSRDLQIGFGNRPNPDANGRGGPTDQKKSRGVASLVLGVPIPDRVKGQPNPGRTKITQERIEPRPEEWQPVTAAPRSSRDGPIGTVPHPVLEPWMLELVQSYFLRLTNSAKDTE